MAALRNFLLRRSPSWRGTNLSTREDCSFLFLLLLPAFHAPRIMLPRFRASVVNGGEGVGTWQLDTFSKRCGRGGEKKFKTWDFSQSCRPPCILCRNLLLRRRRIIFVFFPLSFLKLDTRGILYGFLYGRKGKNIKGIKGDKMVEDN